MTLVHEHLFLLKVIEVQICWGGLGLAHPTNVVEGNRDILDFLVFLVVVVSLVL